MRGVHNYLILECEILNYCIAVESIAQAADRARTRGAQFLHGPAEVPGGAWIVQARDPQGRSKRRRAVGLGFAHLGYTAYAKSACRIAARVAGARCSGNNGRWSDLCGKSY